MERNAPEKIAIVLFNLGGPDNAAAIRPFLFNLFNDPAIISLPGVLRFSLAKFIAWRRAPKAKEIYAHLGGKSPLLENTLAQKNALEAKLSRHPAIEAKAFIAMRYWHPLILECVEAVKKWNPDRVILLPLYPQFSKTTTGSSQALWMKEAKVRNLWQPHHFLCCYPEEPGFVSAVTELTQAALDEAMKVKPKASPLVIFSAHGLPKKNIDAGDPYQHHVKQSASAIAARLNLSRQNWIVSYQSRVGPLEWIGPSTETIIAKGAAEGRSLIVVPIAFVSEHSETLVELDIEYRNLAERHNAPLYIRVPTVSTHPDFISGLEKMVIGVVREKKDVRSESGRIFCREGMFCPCRPESKQSKRKSGNDL